MNNENVIEKLNELLTKNYDAERGYKEAAENTDHAALKQHFLEQSSARYEFGKSIKQEVRNLGGDPDKGTSVAADIHRIWMNVRDFFTKGDSAVVKESLRGEKAALEEYNEFINKPEIPVSVKSLFTHQRNEIALCVEQLEAIENGLS